MALKHWEVAVVISACLGASSGACNRVARQHPAGLEADVFSFHLALKNKDFARAASFMAPKWRAPFQAAWAPTTKGADFLDIDMNGLERSPDLEFAHVQAVLAYTLTGDLVRREHVVRTLWKGEGTGWYLDSAPEPPSEFVVAAPTPPSAGPSPPAPEPADSSSPAEESGFGGG